MARRNVHLFTPANRLQLIARQMVLRLAAWPLLAPLLLEWAYGAVDGRAWGDEQSR